MCGIAGFFDADASFLSNEEQYQILLAKGKDFKTPRTGCLRHTALQPVRTGTPPPFNY